MKTMMLLTMKSRLILRFKMVGFTLLELLITMVLLVSLSVIGLSSYGYFIKKNEQQIIIDELRTAIQYAKLQAIILNKSVFLTPLDSSLNWSKGIILNSLNKKINHLDVIYTWQWSHPRWSLNWVGVSSNDKIFFSTNLMQAISNGRFSLVRHDTNERIDIVLNRMGRIKVINNLSLKQ